jgi:hypothetical protein
MYSPLISNKYLNAWLLRLCLFKLLFTFFYAQTYAHTNVRSFSSEITDKQPAVKENIKITNVFSQAFSQPDNYALPIIRLGHEGEEGFHRQLMIAFEPNTTDGADNGYDSLMLDTFTTDAYWLIDNRSYVIQGRPFRLDLVVDLGVVSGFDQFHTFMIDAFEDFTENVYLLDTQTGEIFDLRVQSPKIFVLAGVHNDRFKLVFSNETLSDRDIAANQKAISGYFDSEVGAFKIFQSQFSDIKSVKIFSISGQIIMHQNIRLNDRESEISIPFYTEATGIYIAKIETASSTDTIKFVKY